MRHSSTAAPSAISATETSPIDPGRKPNTSALHGEPPLPAAIRIASATPCSRSAASGVAVVTASSAEPNPARGAVQLSVIACGNVASMNARPISAGLNRL